jgi:murein DD-endopeptidase MepM/ murein hydrolase activator NlpD
MLAQSIKKKKDEFEQIQDKIEDIEELIEQKGTNKKSNIKKLIANMDKKTKELIVNNIPNGYPSSSKRVTSSFGYRIHPIYKTKRFHHGLDFGGKIGTAIVATADGIVEYAEFNKGGYGNLVVISHNFGFKTAYGHMLDNLKVKKGDFVKKGDVIGYLGNTGLSTGPHLHYEVKYIKNVLNPKNFLTFYVKNFNKLLYNENKIAWDSLTRAIMNLYGRVSLARL